MCTLLSISPGTFWIFQIPLWTSYSPDFSFKVFFLFGWLDGVFLMSLLLAQTGGAGIAASDSCMLKNCH